LDAEGKIHVVGEGSAGPANPHAIGFDAAAQAVLAAVAAARAAAPSGMPIDAACLTLAGVAREGDRQRMEALLLNQLASVRLHFVHDGWATLAAAWADCTGIALIAGTGSFAFGRTRSGRSARSGGWGYLLGDEGSAYDVARSALRAVARAADRRGPPTALTAAALDFFGIAAPQQLIERVYDRAMDRRQIAVFAPRVFEQATDPVAKAIIEQAADELSDLVVGVINQLEPETDERRVALSGGMLVGQPALQERVASRLEHAGVPRDHLAVVNRPVHGALALARTLAQGG